MPIPVWKISHKKTENSLNVTLQKFCKVLPSQKPEPMEKHHWLTRFEPEGVSYEKNHCYMKKWTFLVRDLRKKPTMTKFFLISQDAFLTLSRIALQ